MTGRAFHVLRTLGQGGFGSVYLARARGEGGFSKDVAIKLLKSELAWREDVAGRMRDEARVLGLVRHRAIVQVDGLVQLDGRWAIVMEYVEGVGLQCLLQEAPMPLGPALEVLREIAGALNAAFNAQGPDGPLRLLHRDVKPSNIHLTALGEVKILDFGIARADFEQREASTQGILFGTPNYMAPERFAFEESHSGDIYALGATFYEMLRARPLGRTTGLQESHQAHVDQALTELEKVLSLDPEIPGMLRTMLDWSPERRPSARELERRAASILARHPSPTLRDWAEERVLVLLARQVEPPHDTLSGLTLHEQSGQQAMTWVEGLERTATPAVNATLPMVAAAPPKRPFSYRKFMPYAVFLALLVGGAGGVTLWNLFYPRSPGDSLEKALDLTQTPRTEAPPRVVSQPSTGEKNQPELALELKEQPASQEPQSPTETTPELGQPALSAAEVSPAGSPGASKIEDRPSQPGGVVALLGDARQVVLIAGDRRFTIPGDVPEGTYLIEAEFPSRGRVQAGTIRVVAHARITLTCKDAFGRCSNS